MSAYRLVVERIFRISGERRKQVMNTKSAKARKACGLYLRVSTDQQASVKEVFIEIAED